MNWFPYVTFTWFGGGGGGGGIYSYILCGTALSVADREIRPQSFGNDAGLKHKNIHLVHIG